MCVWFLFLNSNLGLATRRRRRRRCWFCSIFSLYSKSRNFKRTTTSCCCVYLHCLSLFAQLFFSLLLTPVRTMNYNAFPHLTLAHLQEHNELSPACVLRYTTTSSFSHCALLSAAKLQLNSNLLLTCSLSVQQALLRCLALPCLVHSTCALYMLCLSHKFMCHLWLILFSKKRDESRSPSIACPDITTLVRCVVKCVTIEITCVLLLWLFEYDDDHCPTLPYFTSMPI